MKIYCSFLAGVIAFIGCATLPTVVICRHEASNVFLTADGLLAGPGAEFASPEVTAHNPTMVGRSVVLRCQQKGFAASEIPVYVPSQEEKTVRVAVAKPKPPMWTSTSCEVIVP